MLWTLPGSELPRASQGNSFDRRLEIIVVNSKEAGVAVRLESRLRADTTEDLSNRRHATS
jgi:hypothetical protein